jgi:hypothetical protein
VYDDPIYDDYPDVPPGWGGVLLAPWPPPAGQTLVEAQITLWMGEPGEQLGFELAVVPDLYGPGNDGLIVRGHDSAQLFDPAAPSGPVPRTLPLGTVDGKVQQVTGIPDIDADGIGELVVLYDEQRSLSPPYTKLHLVPGATLAEQTGPVPSFEAIASRTIDENWSNPYMVAPPLPTDEALWVGIFSQASPFQTPQGNAWAHHVDLAPGSTTPTVAILPFLTHDKPSGVATLGDDRFVAYDNAERVGGTRVGLAALFANDVAGPVSPNLGASTVLGTQANPLGGIAAIPDMDGDGERELVVVSDRWEVFLSTSLDAAGPLPPDGGDASAPALLRLVPDMNGDGLPELWSAYRVVETSEIPWDGTPLESLPAVWEGDLGAVGPEGATSYSTDIAFLRIGGNDFIAVGMPWLLEPTP